MGPLLSKKQWLMKSMLSFLLLICLFSSCNKSNEPSNLISGEVLNAFTKVPVPDVKVTLLENGPVAYTNANGVFQFSDEDVLAVPESDKISNDGVSGIALSFSHEDYRPREANAGYGVMGQFEIAPDTVPSFYYNEPVLLNDGILTGTLQEVNMEQQLIQNVMDRLYRDEYKEIHSLLIYRNNKLVLEEYFFGNNDTIQFENNIAVDHSPAPIQWSRARKHYVASINKSLTSSLVGIALDQFNLSVDSKISNYLPEYAPYFDDPNKAAIDFEDCLTMTAGFQWDEWGANDLELLWKSGDFANFVLDRTNFGPGFEWRYNSALPNLLIKSMDNMVGGSLRNWANEHFYQKLGITDINWQSQPDGFPEGAARMFIRPRDMLKVGITYLNNGVWDDTQVIPEAWVNECFTVNEQTSSGDYSYGFWLRNLGNVTYLSADGDGGNYINIFPSLDMVIVMTQGNYLLWPLYVNQADDILENYIIPATQ